MSKHELMPCTCGETPKVEYYDDDKEGLWAVTCSAVHDGWYTCWHGREAGTREGAIEYWNQVMAK